MLHNGIDNDIVTVDFFKGNFPFTVALLSIAGYLREEGCTVLETQFTGILDGFGKLVIADMPASFLQSLREWRAEKTVHNTVPCSSKYFRHIFLR